MQEATQGSLPSNCLIVSSSRVDLERQSRRTFLLQLLLLSKQILSSSRQCAELKQTASHGLVVLLSFWDENCDSFESVISELDFQDDFLIGSISALLDLWILSRSVPSLKTTYPALAELLNQVANPHIIFFFLLRSMSFDANVMMDFLLDQEDGFAEYLLKYLRLIQADAQHFIACVSTIDLSESDNDEDDGESEGSYGEKDPAAVVTSLLATLAQLLKQAASKHLLQYNISPLHKQLESSLSLLS
eukprot:TRINITY_DN6711_c0_g1_i1.p1 TRINITY_DN6711_c0_g1~~TRINITY_DN6711_c0_g1_i1.p1  ORF type:complete len:246 (+),score=46.33 TRINITY_DN6711_c0_g1_i1:238-975(+)